ncbi:MAG: flagellar brake protein [Pseudomonadota bacterium]
MIPVRKTDVVLGKPLPYSLYDQNNKLLLKAGVVVQTQNQLDVLSERGLYRDRMAANQVQAPSSIVPDGEPAPDKDGILLDLEDIRLQVGDLLQLQGVAADAPRHAVKLLGYAKGRSVMVTPPMVDGAYAMVKQDAAFVVRFFSGKSVYAFPAHVLKMSNTPFPYLHLSYPKKVRGMRVRRAQCASVRLISSVTDMYGALYAGTLVDISKGGALLAAKAALGEIGDLLQLKFRLQFDDIDQFVHIKAGIRSVRSNPDSEGEAFALHHGLEFVEVQGSDRLALSAYTYQKLIEASDVA